MHRITIFKRTTKKDGVIKLRFRLRDGRSIDLYHKSDIIADLKSLDKFTEEGKPKPKVSVYDKDLQAKITEVVTAMNMAYREMKDKGMSMTGYNFESTIDKILHPDKVARAEARTLLARFERFAKEGQRDGLFGVVCSRQYEVIRKELRRFLIINKIEDILPADFTADILMELAMFFRDEYLYVDRWSTLYEDVKERNKPKERRSQNTVASKMSKMQAFFNDLEDKEEIVKSPFRKLGKERKRVVLKEQYDDPIFLYKEELLNLIASEVPPSLQETKDAFVLQCAFGCRIGDFQSLTMDKVAVNADGIPYIHYLPQKTKRELRSEIETPIMLYALDIIKKYRFEFSVLNYVSGKTGYNAKIKDLLEYCKIDRQCKVYDEQLGDYTFIPLYKLGSSKLCRKTHVDMMNKVQVNQYAAGLHSEGSDAVNRYTHLELRDRFVLMCAAFGQPQYKVDNNLEMIEEEQNGEV